ncbi:MAG TPA: antitoxin VapB family protein [Thermoplasmata archaeon]|nr:antitoxin VapB family protein [Thermoplasmata archaeon]
MSSRNIAVRKDVYDALRKERRPSESFTKLLIRLLNQRGGLHDLAGAWPGRSSRRERTTWRQLRGVAASGEPRR